jgi:hypothetical protein
MSTYPLNIYKQMGSCYRRSLLNAPAVVADEMEHLGELIDDLAAFVGSGGYDAGDLQEIQDAQQEAGVMYQLGQAIGPKVKKLFVVNGLERVYGYTLSSFRVTNDEGDLLLSKIADQCGLIATKVLADVKAA